MARYIVTAAAVFVALTGPGVARGEGLREYNAIGVGEQAEGLLHAEAGSARADLGLGETSAGIDLPFGLAVRMGYQFGGYAFAGFSRRKLSARVGIVPDKGTWGAGIGYGAPLLPLPAVVTSSALRCYSGLAAAGLDPRIIDVLSSGSGPLGDAVSGGSNMPFGFGAQLVVGPERGALDFFVGVQTVL